MEEEGEFLGGNYGEMQCYREKADLLHPNSF